MLVEFWNYLIKTKCNKIVSLNGDDYIQCPKGRFSNLLDNLPTNKSPHDHFFVLGRIVRLNKNLKKKFVKYFVDGFFFLPATPMQIKATKQSEIITWILNIFL